MHRRCCSKFLYFYKTASIVANVPAIAGKPVILQETSTRQSHVFSTLWYRPTYFRTFIELAWPTHTWNLWNCAECSFKYIARNIYPSIYVIYAVYASIEHGANVVNIPQQKQRFHINFTSVCWHWFNSHVCS